MSEPQYRMLTTGEKIEAGDEYRSSVEEKWISTSRCGEIVVDDGEVYRRRVTCGEEWETLKSGDVIKQGDRVLRDGSWYTPLFSDGIEVAVPAGSTAWQRKAGDWRTLRPGEVVKKGDQYSSPGAITWGEAGRIGCVVQEGDECGTYRRPRFFEVAVDEDDIIVRGDEVRQRGGTRWEPAAGVIGDTPREYKYDVRRWYRHLAADEKRRSTDEFMPATGKTRRRVSCEDRLDLDLISGTRDAIVRRVNNANEENLKKIFDALKEVK